MLPQVGVAFAEGNLRTGVQAKSQIPEPPVAPALLQPRKPKAQRIHQHDYANPYRVHDPERVAEVRRVELRG